VYCVTDDGDWASGANPNFSGDEGGDEDEEEESKWRTARLERETWLQENKVLNKYLVLLFYFIALHVKIAVVKLINE
jgi:hypothetical protein